MTIIVHKVIIASIIAQLNDQGVPQRKYGPRSNANKNNMGEVVNVEEEHVEEEVVEVRRRTRTKKKKFKVVILIRPPFAC